MRVQDLDSNRLELAFFGIVHYIETNILKAEEINDDEFSLLRLELEHRNLVVFH